MPASYSNTVQAGRYRYRLTFQVRVEVDRDETGEPIFEWVDDFTLRGAYEPLKAELLHTDVGDKRFALSEAMFRVRYQPDRLIDATKHRIAFVSDPKSSPLGLSIWNISPPLQMDGVFKELFIKARQYR